MIPLHCGECLLGENHVLGNPFSDDDRIPFTLYAFLADGGPGRRVLIDLGPIGLKYLNDMFRRYHFFRDLPGDPDDIRQPHGNIFDWLDRLGYTPADIDHIVFTHLHADHHGLTDGTDAGGILRFPEARVHVSRIGWDENLARRDGENWNSYVDFAFADFLLAGGKTGRVVFHDDAEIVPGVRTMHLGGHSVCSQAVEVQTIAGPAIVSSDEVYRYDILDRGVVARLHTTPENLLQATELLVDRALAGAVILPCHEPALAEAYTRYGDAWIEHVRPQSDDAARAFRTVPKHLVG
jgi:glyoxylase-like metal-dependent hydrolase (beta-lactamase superfamily II)